MDTDVSTADVLTPRGPAADLEQLGDQIAELSAHLDAATARLLDMIREFDARGGWNTGFRSCAEWLAWRANLDIGTARQKVRVARALPDLPRMAQALARGELSYAKVRALTRVARPETEERLLALGRACTAEQVERIVRGWRRMDRKAEAREAARQHTSRALHVYQDEDGTVTVRGRLAPEVGALLLKALAAARETLYQQARAQRADAPGDVSYETFGASGCRLREALVGRLTPHYAFLLRQHLALIDAAPAPAPDRPAPRACRSGRSRGSTRG